MSTIMSTVSDAAPARYAKSIFAGVLIALVLSAALSPTALAQSERGSPTVDGGPRSGSRGSGSSGTTNGSSSSGSNSANEAYRERQRALDELTSSLGAAMDDSRRRSAEKNSARRDQQQWEDQQAELERRLFSDDYSCGRPNESALSLSRRVAILEDDVSDWADISERACRSGGSRCSSTRRQYTEYVEELAESSCLLRKAEALESYEAAQTAERRQAEMERRQAELANKAFEQFLTGDLIDAQLDVATFLAKPQPYRRTSSDGRVEVLNYSLQNMNPSCFLLQNGTVQNNCTTELNVGWMWLDAQGPCATSGSASTSCATALRPGASVNVVQNVSARMGTCVAPYFPVPERDRSGFSCWAWKTETSLSKSTTGKSAQSQVSSDQSYSKQIGNKAILTSEPSLAALLQ